jgi:hypothetical protein
MTEQWVREAIAEQEEYIKRWRSCMDTLGRSHTWRRHGNPTTKEAYEACVVCGVTKTREDYAKRLG